MGGAKLAADRDRMCELDKGEAARGRYGIVVDGVQEGEDGEDVGDGSVDRRRVGGFREKSSSGGPSVEELWSLRLGRGEGRNSSMRSVSGTGSMAAIEDAG